MFVIRFFISYSCKAVFKVCDDVVYMLCANRKTNGVLVNTCWFKFFLGKLRMSGCCRMDNKGLHICNICKQWEYLQSVNETEGFLFASLDIKCKDRAAAVREILFVQRMIWMIGQRRMIYLFNKLVIYEIIKDFLGVFSVTLQTQRKCLCTLQEKESGKRRYASTCVSEENSTDVCCKSGFFLRLRWILRHDSWD